MGTGQVAASPSGGRTPASAHVRCKLTGSAEGCPLARITDTANRPDLPEISIWFPAAVRRCRAAVGNFNLKLFIAAVCQPALAPPLLAADLQPLIVF
jgi:hypothetical protein